MKVRTAVLIVFGILALTAGLSLVEQQPTKQNWSVVSAVIGKITDESDRPLEGVTVAAGGNRTAITNDGGNYLLSLGNSTKEDFIDIFIDKKGFKTQIRTVTGGGIQTLNIMMIRD